MLLRRYVLSSTLIARMLRFEYVKKLYVNNDDFANVFNACKNPAFEKIYRLDGYLLKENRLCVPLSFIHELLIYEAHEGGLMREFWCC